MKKKYDVKNTRICTLVLCIAAVCTGVFLAAGFIRKSDYTAADPIPRLTEPGEEVLLEDFLESGEASAVRHIYYWFHYRKYELASIPQNVTRVLDIVRESGYEKLDTQNMPNDSFMRFELATDSEKFFLGVTETDRPYIAFGGNQYIAGQNILSRIANMESMEHEFVNSESQEREAADGAVEERKMLIELFESGDAADASEIDCWHKGNLYKLTDDPQTVQWFMQALHPDHLTRLKEDDWAAGFPELDLEVVVKGERYDFSVGGEYLYIGQSQFTDKGEVYKKIREIGSGIFSSAAQDSGPVDIDARPQYVEPGKEMELRDFLGSSEAEDVTRINDWVDGEKYRFTTTAEKSREFLDILRKSGYEKIDIGKSDECRSVFERDRVDTFEIFTGGKKYFLSVSRAEPNCFAFGGNHYITDRAVYPELLRTGEEKGAAVDSSDGEEADTDEIVEEAEMLSEFFLNGGDEEILTIVCWREGNLYKLTDDSQKIRWFLEALNPDHLSKAEAEEWFEGKGPEMAFAMVAGRKKYVFYVNEPYISTGRELLKDDGSVYGKIQEISGWDLEN